MSDAKMSQVIVPKSFTTLGDDDDKRAVIEQLARALADARKIKVADIEPIVEGALAREAVGSTGIGHGIAIPHFRTDIVKQFSCAYGRCPDGLDFDSLDGEPVHSVFLLLTPEHMKSEHLELMKSFASQIRKDHFCNFLRDIDSGEALVDLLKEFEA